MTWGVVNMYEVAIQCWERGEVESMIKFQHEIDVDFREEIISV